MVQANCKSLNSRARKILAALSCQVCCTIPILFGSLYAAMRGNVLLTLVFITRTVFLGVSILAVVRRTSPRSPRPSCSSPLKYSTHQKHYSLRRFSRFLDAFPKQGFIVVSHVQRAHFGICFLPCAKCIILKGFFLLSEGESRIKVCASSNQLSLQAVRDASTLLQQAPPQWDHLSLFCIGLKGKSHSNGSTAHQGRPWPFKLDKCILDSLLASKP